MSEIKNNNGYSDQYFVNLFEMATRLGTVYAVDDGNHYTDEASAISRCKDALKLRKIKRYAKITAETCPMNYDELQAMMVSVDNMPANPVAPVATKPKIDLDKARKAFEERKAKRGRKTAAKE